MSEARLALVTTAVDDLKAFYVEARMAEHPRASYQELYAWFWSDTALAGLLRSIRDRLKADGDPVLKANGDPVLDQIAFGIAR
jgi:hypothetical protein